MPKKISKDSNATQQQKYIIYVRIASIWIEFKH